MSLSARAPFGLLGPTEPGRAFLWVREPRAISLTDLSNYFFRTGWLTRWVWSNEKCKMVNLVVQDTQALLE